MLYLISYSALKKDGERLSTLMKRGEAVEAKPARPVRVYSLSLRQFQPPLFTLGKGQRLLHRVMLPACLLVLIYTQNGTKILKWISFPSSTYFGVSLCAETFTLQ